MNCLHLCEHCKQEYPTCETKRIIFECDVAAADPKSDKVIWCEGFEKADTPTDDVKPVVEDAVCKHEKTFSYNHGYHKICEACGVELD